MVHAELRTLRTAVDTTSGARASTRALLLGIRTILVDGIAASIVLGALEAEMVPIQAVVDGILEDINELEKSVLYGAPGATAGNQKPGQVG